MLSTLAAGIDSRLGLVLAAGLGVAAGGFAYASHWPSSHLFGRALTAPARPGELALTFDDGPNPACTPQLLDTLAAHHVQATFFLLGGFAQSQPELVRRIAGEGHLIGNHSWSHPDLSRTPARRIREELARTSGTLEQITGAPVRYFRPPYGARRPVVFRIARELGLIPVLWNAMTTDWSEPAAERISARLAQKIDRLTRAGRAVNIVLHDGGHRGLGANRNPSIQAAGRLIASYGQTHTFVTLRAWEA
ncbi:MAG TPA: polysaccharide deacetylase family protein [Terracidiphilus sp.]|jgi:peptidoglycan/xylan/chitin deacetylase (PgdA/CDA1 family)|nr:polysaccharide deacetylase family protein [Terracidiphilus sp.]